MPNLFVYPWLEPYWRQLAAYIEQQRIPQALLMRSSAGMGTLELAETFARSLLCEARIAESLPCSICRSCHLFNVQTHPDYFFIEPEDGGKAIGVDRIRQLIAQLTLKPQFHSNRVVIINAADALNNAAANAFLKCLEEPTDRTVIILLAEKISKLPPTIRSRCQIMGIEQPSKGVVLEWLRSHQVENGESLLKLSGGAPLLAKQYAEQNLLAVREQYLTDWLKIAQGNVDVIRLAERWYQQETVSLSLLLAWMVQWITAIVKLAFQVDCDVPHKKALQELTKRLDLQEVYRFYDSLQSSVEKIDTQINKQLLVEQLLIEWSKLNQR